MALNIVERLSIQWKTYMSQTSVAVVGKTLALLEHLALHGEAGVSQLSRDLHLPLSTVHRLLTTLSSAGYVLQDRSTQGYQLSTKVLQLSGSVLRRLNVRAIALPHMQSLAARWRETVNLCVLEGTRIVYAETVPSPEPLRFETALGADFAPHCTGTGKAICAHLARSDLAEILPKGPLPRFTSKTITDRRALFRHLEETRARGYAFDNEERHYGIRCVAAPIWDRHDKMVAAVSLVAPTVRMPDTRVAEGGIAVMQTAAQISAELGFCPDRVSGRRRRCRRRSESNHIKGDDHK
jgi:IclR family acetate operon transcriptional repressor